MNLFLAAMLLLVLGDNYLVLYVGWEGVGLASYLLIGFWQYKNSAAVAAKKAFIVNRVGDAGLTLAIFLMFTEFGTVSFTGVFGSVGSAGSGVATALGLLLLLGACGKSAQVPLQSWLLDAMEGPTPVSALIHAATMVTAGVYLLVRSNPILALSSDARLAVVLVGTVTLLFGGIIACAKDDIKKSLAGSTMSQIGYMTLGAGLGPAGYVFAIALLLAHGFFKAGLFLGAGSVMHGMNDEVEHAAVRRAGPDHAGHLRHVRPGVPGHHRHPAVLRVLHQGPHHRGGFQRARRGRQGTRHLALIGAGITAFYMTRMMFMTWYGKRRWEPEAHPHESPPDDDLADDRPRHRLGGCRRVPYPQRPAARSSLPRWSGSRPPRKACSARRAWWPWRSPWPAWPWPGSCTAGCRSRRSLRAGGPLTVAARKELYGDAFNESVLMRPGQWLTRLSVFFDNRGVDGLVNTLAAAVGGTSGRVRKLQTGFVRSYALSMFFGAAVLVALLLVVRL